MSDFLAGDVGEIRITLGDANKDGMVDVRVTVFAKLPLLETEPTEKMHLGPFNVPVKQALQVAVDVVRALPIAAAPVAGMAVGIAAGAAGALPHLLTGK